jgi:cell division protein FtsB
MSVSGFLENVGKNAKEVVSGTVDAFSQAAKSAAYIIENAEHLDDVSPEYLAQDLKNVGKALVHAVTDKYQEHGLRAAYEKPIDVVGDVMTVLSAGGGAAAKLGKVTGATKLEAAGKAVARVPGYLGEKVAELPLRAVGIKPELRKILLGYDRNEAAIGAVTQSKLEGVLDEKFKGLADPQKELLDKMAILGTDDLERTSNPLVTDARNAYRGIVKELREKQLGEGGRRLLTTEEMDTAVAKKYANRKYGDVSKEAVTKAKAEIAAMSPENRPIYTPAVGAGKEVGIMDLLWGPDEIKLGKVGFLEPFKGGKFSSDPVLYMKKAVSAFIAEETRMRFMDRVIGDPRLTKAIKAGEAALGDLVPEGMHKKYFADKARAQRIVERDLRIKGAEKALLDDPVTQKYVQSIAAVGATDSTVANYLRATFKRTHGPMAAFLRVYDKIINTFKVSATTLNPRYYTGNIVGDGILSVMAGEFGLHWGVAKRIMDSLPPELRAGTRAVVGDNPILAKFQNLTQIAQAADDLARAGIWTKEVAGKFKNAGASFTGAEQAFEAFARQVGESVEELSNLQVKSQIVGEHLVRSSGELYKLNKKIDTVTNRMAVVGMKADDLQARGGSPAQVEKLKAKETRLWQISKELEGERDKVLTRARRRLIQSGEYHKRIQEAGKYAEVANAATDRANAFLGDYMGLGPIERAIFRRVVPFYSFTKAMTKLAFTYPFIAPKTSFFWHRYSQALADMSTDPDMPDWMAGYFPVGGSEKGETYWIRLSQLGPFGGVKTGRAGDMPVPGIVQFWQQNPILKLGYRAIGGRDEFYWAGKPKAGDTWVQAGEGKITRFRPDGTLETVVPQMSPIEGLETMFPVVQVMNQLIQSYDVGKGNAQKPDGSPKHPVTTTDKVLRTIGISTKTGSPEDFRRGEKYGVRKTIEELKKAYPRMDPEQREAAREYVRDFSRGYYRKFRSAQ